MIKNKLVDSWCVFIEVREVDEGLGIFKGGLEVFLIMLRSEVVGVFSFSSLRRKGGVME